METLLVEIGSEEIPAGYIAPALDALKSKLLKKLDDARIDHGPARIYGTPRRLAVSVAGVAKKQSSISSEIVGPPVRVGFDKEGKPTVAAVKFAEKIGVSVRNLKTKETDKGDYLVAVRSEKGVATKALLASMLPDIILSLPFPKSMRWADLNISFARPIHYVLALLGSQSITFEMGNLKSGRHSVGHYFMDRKKIKISDPADYIETLRSANVIVDIEERKKIVLKEINKAAKKAGGKILADEELLDTVTNLVEYPVPSIGKFDDDFLELPKEILITAMREHQKYFAVIDRDDNLLPSFIAMNNTRAKDMNLVAKGHERVLRARLKDAQFFYRSDLDVTSENRVEKLKGVLFQAKLGTMYQKIERIEAIAALLSKMAGLNKTAAAQLSRAAYLCKSDLVSHVVGEFPKLQGVMGRTYASVSKEKGDIPAAIEEHYRPIYSGGSLPETKIGALLSIADKFDSICGCFSVGLVPTGASDPYALRRQGIGIIQIMLDNNFTFSLDAVIEACLSQFEKNTTGQIRKQTDQIRTFLRNRMSHLLADEGYSKDVIAAVTHVSVDCVPDVWNRVKALEALKAEPDFEPLAIAFKRVVNIIRKAKSADIPDVNASLFEESSEKGLSLAFNKVQKKVIRMLKKGHFSEALVEIASLKSPVDRFFDEVLVMAENKKVRQNRLALLKNIADLFAEFADFSKLST